MIKKIFKFVIVTFLFVVGTVLVAHLYDSELKKEARNFFEHDQISPKNNFYVIWSGLHAPIGTKDLTAFYEDVYVAKHKLNKSKMLRFNDNMVSEKNYCVYQTEALQYLPPHIDRSKCMSRQDFENVGKANSEILERLQNLYHNTPNLDVYLGDEVNLGYLYLQDILSMQSFLCKKWEYQSQNSNEKEAIQEWIESVKAIQHIIQGQVNFADHMLWMTAYFKTIDCLPVILENDLSLTQKFGDEIKNILNFDYIQFWNIKDMLKAEGNFLISIEEELDGLSKQIYTSNKARNRYFDASASIEKMSALSLNEIENTALELREEYSCTILQLQNCLFYNSILNNWLYDFERYGTMFARAHEQTAKQNAIILWITAHQNNVSLADMNDHVQQFNNDTNFDVLLKWDSNRKAIYHDSIRANAGRQYLVYYNEL